MKKIFVFDTDNDFKTQVKSLCPLDKVEVRYFSSSMEIFSLISKEIPLLIFVDFDVPDVNEFVIYDLLKISDDNSIPVKGSADPKYRFLAMEPIGVIYIAGQQPLKSHIIGINIPPIPDQKSLSAFFAHFSEGTRFFHDGVISALSFLEWNLPGLLESLEENRYTEKAREMVNSYRANGGVYRL